MRVETIETERLYLRGFQKEDALFAIGIWNNPEMGEYLPDEAMVEIDEAYLKEIEALAEDEVCCYMIAEFKDTHERIGTCSFIPSEGGKIYDIAYCVHKNYWGNGYATEMAGGMVNYAKEHGACKVTVRVNKDNAASNAVVRKIGFKVIGEKYYKKRGTELEFTDYLYELNFRIDKPMN
ncbi:MAG: GNAT family N-acetyltransferase [Lachnospiraceae bacterium]|nr:GNAT family N-acetyltransferase [Lachnospiraceae bacterium]